MTLKTDAKFEGKLTLSSKKDMRNLVNFHPITQKSKNFTLMDYFCPKCMRFELNMDSFICPKHIIFQLQKFRGVMCHDTEW